MEMSTNLVQENVYKCTLAQCDNTFSSVSFYENHLETAHIAKVEVKKEPKHYWPKFKANREQKIKRCQFCDLELNVTNSNFKLITHLKSYHSSNDINELIENLDQEEIKVTCYTCGNQLRNSRILKSHIQLMHTELKMAPCPTCGKLLKQHDGVIWQHLKSHENNGFTCEYCGKTLSSKKSYNGHKTIHMTDVKKVQCDECYLQFDRQNYLYVHKKRIHSKTPRVGKTCHLCGKTLTTPFRLRAHINSVHFHEKPFVCDLCVFTTSAKSNLNTHRKTNHGMDI